MADTTNITAPSTCPTCGCYRPTGTCDSPSCQPKAFTITGKLHDRTSPVIVLTATRGALKVRKTTERMYPFLVVSVGEFPRKYDRKSDSYVAQDHLVLNIIRGTADESRADQAYRRLLNLHRGEHSNGVAILQRTPEGYTVLRSNSMVTR